ncbi:phage tail spike protein [Ligilactobacillus acidipiscis]|uniref:phage tail spike protein n=1 Tax=Ligilactobacillus acidipiscis TaxID=89059 RepID=UPI0023FA0391|nr:phage tail spike protein [Ligilactobacillus acidipiscis]WEV56125.1 GH25 family lysozyme [Ligilactobacillus acidipiscis]
MAKTGYKITVRQGFEGREHLLNSDADDSHRLISATVSKEINSYPSLSITVPPSNVRYDDFKMYTTFVRVIRADTGKVVFDGRVITPSDSMDSSGTLQESITVEGVAGFLHDSVPAFKEFHNTTPRDFLQWLIDQHNSQTETYKHIRLGTVNVTNSTDNVYRYTDEEKDTFSNIQDKLTSRLGGEIVVHEDNGLVLDYLVQQGGIAQQPIELAQNLVSLTRQTDPTSIFTVLKPLGATQEPSDGGSTDTAYPRLNISSVNGGSSYLYDQDLIQQYGTQVKTQTWDDVTTAQQLKEKGRAMLANQANLKVTLQLSYLDLSHVTPDHFTAFELGDTVHVISSVQSIDMYERVTAMSIDLLSISNSSLTIGEDDMNEERYEKMQRTQSNSDNALLREQMDSQARIAAQNNADMAKTIADLQDQINKLSNSNSGGSGSTAHIGKIIDLSEFQGSVDWAKVNSDDVSLATIRVQDGSDHEDKTYKNNFANAQKNGVRYAAYAFFRGQSLSDSENEATNFYNRAKGAAGSGAKPVFYMIDVETTEMNHTISAMRNGVEAYMNKLNSLGIPDNKIVLYIANQMYSSLNLNVSRAGSIVIPSYGKNDGTLSGSSKPGHPYDLWQYTSKGSVAGISGNVDMNTEPSDRFKSQYLS